MREIKFRAWNGAKMLKQDEIAFTHGISNVAFRFSDMLSHLQKDYAVMQFTGLKDKNGKEIYEGDIVRYGDFEGDMLAKNYEVEYMGADYYPAFDMKGFDGETNGLCWAMHDGHIEVIGNIYENPELLK